MAVWLVIGVLAAAQRGYFAGNDANCTKLGTIAITIVAGPLNHLGVNPKMECEVPQPSRKEAPTQRSAHLDGGPHRNGVGETVTHGRGVLHVLAELLELKGDLDGARDAYQRLADEDPAAPRAGQARAKVAELTAKAAPSPAPTVSPLEP